MSDPCNATPVLARLHGATKSYGKVRALDGVDLALRGGELLALLGPNGAGKTTAIGLLLGLLRADGGTVELFGRDPQALDAQREVDALQRAYLPVGLRRTVQAGQDGRGVARVGHRRRSG